MMWILQNPYTMCKVLKSLSGSFRIPPHADAHLLEMQMIYKVTLVSKCWFHFFLPSRV